MDWGKDRAMGRPQGPESGKSVKVAADGGDIGSVGGSGGEGDHVRVDDLVLQQAAAAVSPGLGGEQSPVEEEPDGEGPAQVPASASAGTCAGDSNPTPDATLAEGSLRIRGSLDGRLPPGAYAVEGPAARQRRRRSSAITPSPTDVPPTQLRRQRQVSNGDAVDVEQGAGGSGGVGSSAAVTGLTALTHEAIVTDAVAIPVDDDDDDDEAQQRRRQPSDDENGTAVVSAVMDSEAIAQHEQRLVEQTREETKRELTNHRRKTWLLVVVCALLLILVVVISVSVVAVSGNSTAAPPSADESNSGVAGADKCSRYKVVPDGVRQGDHFGYAVDLSGDMMLVGAAFSSPRGEESGTAYIFRRNQQDNTWLEEASISPEDGTAGDKFGVKLALNDAGDVAVISADQADLGKGAVYVYSRSVSNEGPENRPTTLWILQAKLVAEDETEAAQFGDSVDIQGNTIVVGASHPNQPRKTGAVYIFEKDNGSAWVQTDKLIPSDYIVNSTDESVRFGRSVALASDILVVGADKDGPNGLFSGSAYIYRREINLRNEQALWIEEAKIYPDDGGESQYFGHDVDIDKSGSTVVVSSWKDGEVTNPATEEKDAKTEQMGSVYIFNRDGSFGQWTQQAKITAEDAEPGDRFGNSISINGDGDTVLVGAYHDDERRGSAYLFRRDDESDASSSWTQTMKLRAGDVNAVEEFANQVVLDGLRAAISEVKDIDNGYEAGAIHEYDIGKCLSW